MVTKPDSGGEGASVASGVGGLRFAALHTAGAVARGLPESVVRFFAS